jgi:nucleoside 2-deoxyribosyltransferase/phage shock protein A
MFEVCNPYMEEKKEAFVVLPFESDFNQVYNEVMEPALEEVGYEINKADSIDSQQNILEDIIRGISEADLLIADLTSSNPNVFYELGIAHGLGIPTVLITQDLEEVPFDLRAYKIIEYSTEFTEIGDLQNELREIGEKHLDGEMTFGSPVSDFTSGDPSNSQSAQKEDEEIENEPSEPDRGVLDYAEEAEERRVELESDILEIEDDTNELEEQVQNLVEEVSSLAQEKGRVSPKKANRLAREAARKINDYNDSVEGNIESVEENLEFLLDTYQSFIEFSDPTNPEHRTQLQEQKEEFSEFVLQIEETEMDISQFKSEIEGLKGINRELTQACNSLSKSLDSLIDALNESSAKAERMISLIMQELRED